MNHGSKDSNFADRSERPENKTEQLKTSAENKERGEACTELANGALNKDIQAATLERRLSRKSGATGYGVASADSLLPLNKKSKLNSSPDGLSEQEYATAVKKFEAQQKERQPVGIIAQVQQQQNVVNDGGGQSQDSSKPEFIAQIRPNQEAVHEAVMTGIGHVHGAVNFTANTLIGIGDALRMASAAERKINVLNTGQPDIDPEGTKKLQETCQGLAMGSRVLLQFSTTLNKESPFYGNDFDPQARQAAEKLSKEMPEKLKQEISQFKNSGPEARAAKSTELLLDIYTCAETGGLMLSKAGQIAKETKAMSQISHDMQTFAAKLREFPPSENANKMREFLDKNLPRFGPELATDGPPIKAIKPINSEAEDQALKMVKHSDRGKSFDHSGDKVRESKKLDEMREAHRITQEGWAETHEKKTVKYIRDKGEVIDKNKFEGTFPDDSPYRRQTDGIQWELKSMSKVEKSKNIVDAILAHARDGADKFTGKEHIGRVLIDAREQRWMTEKIAEKAMEEAVKQTPKLKEIRVIGNNFDISLKPGQKAVTKR